ncbi:acetyl-CoA carboxylase biotin carboxyl carrier protein [Blochmannia endosymbiont of Polyrhachis (Hedomyrma) turneri]|uniref:acetyl-CoA carboxylase biotin carboxyl carrier protein n=1 Tax=Blochmannia endosymbiont of Polyrhachis (Hedomyrma) turneri TaxID=1505596 RepID=UPI00061A64EF|nr:acetyl-CoA carboxylase biotin carboxyl carrier protein [Blochmannia endosymbiont of Polyrhachis (Hedomyrma) turneri]AKC59846.1 Biotin carboxyl carrier protein of acetyl-CoA carboxylase [Blochmannia endosymbiont of Polyrhachis (Hedomyrma) turneri]
MDIHKIKKLIQIIEASSISEIEISEGNEILRMKRFISKVSNSPSDALTKKVDDIVLSQETMLMNENLDIKNTQDAIILNDKYVVRSPMVGVFYSTSSPGLQPFVSIGQKVNIGDVLCIIEAMKIMNHIESDKNGIVKSILIKNGQPVEFNEPLFIIE